VQHRTSTPKYEAAHWRIRRKRGSATAHVCSVCDDQASSWAYMHDCEDEVTDAAGKTYCYHIEHYSAMCASCHTKFDGRYGETSKQAVLTDAIVMVMRQEYATGQYTRDEIGERYGVNKDTAANAIAGGSWMHLPVIGTFKRPGRTKLTYQQAEEIRATYATGTITQAALAQQYSMSQQAVSNIVNNKTYTHPESGIRGTLK
jgi:hypothetical protein